MPSVPFFDASGSKNSGATILIGQEIWCLSYAGFLVCAYKSQDVAQIQKKFVRCHNRETVTFVNSAILLAFHIYLAFTFTKVEKTLMNENRFYNRPQTYMYSLEKQERPLHNSHDHITSRSIVEESVALYNS